MVFEDKTSRRWTYFRLAAAAGVLVALGAGVVLALSVASTPQLPRLPHAAATPLDEATTIEAVADPSPAATPRSTASRAGGSPAGFLRTAFVVQDDPASLTDLATHGQQLDIVFPDWFTVGDYSEGTLASRVSPECAKLLRAGRAKVYPRLSNVNAQGAWQGSALSDLLRDEDAADGLIDELVAALKKAGAAGVNIDFEEVEPEVRDKFSDWLEALASDLHDAGLHLTVDVPVGEEESFDYEEIGRIADHVVLMGYDEHYPGSAPGSIAGEPWFEDAVQDMAERVPPAKLIAAIGAYGYDWNTTHKRPAAALGFAEAMDLAARTHAHVKSGGDSVNATFTYRADDGDRHEVWFLDAVSAWNQLQAARGSKYGGVSVWRLGVEEPAFWDVMSDASFDPRRLGEVRLPPSILFRGQGELLDVKSLAKPGKRALTFDGTRIDSAEYDAIPTPDEVRRSGRVAGKKIALTFDDGPDPTWTPLVLKVLREQHVPATFFTIGEQVQRFPELARQEVAEGHLLGNHTYRHPTMSAVTPARLRAELTATQRTIELATGRQTLLFRTPYDTDTTPTAADQLSALNTAGTLGYVCVGGDVDSDDYDRPGVDAIVRKTLAALADGGGNIVVMHDAGGDRSQTVAALSQLIPALRARGYEFVSVADLAGAPADAVMPPVAGYERWLSAANAAIAWSVRNGWSAMMAIFLLTTAFAVGRSLLLAVLVYRGSRRKSSRAAGDFEPPVLVLVPAYNEAKVIARTVNAVLQSDYPDFRVLVVDDGSTDSTAEIVEEIAERDDRVSVLRKTNGGKFSALNRGFREAWEEYVVTIDADTVILPDTVSQLVAPFAGGDVDAVCGNVMVGNVMNLLTRFQDAEYVTSQNYDRRAFDAVNCIPVVPGATGAWKRRAVLRCGGYSADTLTEDADLTLELLRHGGRIVYAPEARSITEAPKDTSELLRQRFRWGYGTLQCLWKHRGGFCRGSVGWIALPNLLLFQLLFPVLAPLSLIVVTVAVAGGHVLLPAIWYGVFLAIDLCSAAVAFRLERRSWREIWVPLLQRFYYRPFMYWVTLRSVLAAVRGRRHGWNKLARQGTVRPTRGITPAPRERMPTPVRHPAEPARAYELRPQPAAVNSASA